MPSPDRYLHASAPTAGPDAVELARVRNDETLFYLLSSASLAESAAALYTERLVDHVAPHTTGGGWLRQRWKADETAHGRALRAYVNAVWPEFCWEKAFASFYSEYADMYERSPAESSRALEMAGRCVLESATAAFYEAIHRYTDEPSLKELTRQIRNDELRHYRHFLRLFREFNAWEQRGRAAILVSLLRHLLETRRDDADVALRHVLRIHRPAQATAAQSAVIARDMRRLVREHLPGRFNYRLVIGPMAPTPRFERWLDNVMALLARYFVLS